MTQKWTSLGLNTQEEEEEIQRRNTEPPTILREQNNADWFLIKAHDKKQLIILLVISLQKNDVEVRQSSGDADVLIAQTAVEVSEVNTNS